MTRADKVIVTLSAAAVVFAVFAVKAPAADLPVPPKKSVALKKHPADIETFRQFKNRILSPIGIGRLE